ncbi:hypothetical protein V2J09_015935 [Rumex salicifolius]
MARGVKAEPNSSRDAGRWRSVHGRSVTDSNDTVPQKQQQQNEPQKRRRDNHPSQVPRQEEQQNAPDQDVAERRAIRRRFRDVKNLINEEREEIYRPGSDKFDSIINEVQALHQQVHKPREQVADAEALLDITNNLLTTVKAHKSEGVTPGDFINLLVRDFGQQDIANGSAEGSGYTILWKELGLAVSHVLKRAPGCCTMLGPMDVEFKQKQRRTGVRMKRDRSAEKERPEELSNKKEEMTDTDKNMATMFNVLKKNRKVQLENLILNRNYFAQTVENLFALSFLVKDGRAEITVDEDGNHFVVPKNAPAANAVASGQVSYCHFVFRFDFRDWKLMLDSVKEGEELMPHRQPTVDAGSFKGATKNAAACAEHQTAGMSTTPIRKRTRNRGLVIQEQAFVEDSPEDADGVKCNDATIRGRKRKLL